ncbi:MAG: PAS domain-containing protein, partial [Myxococcales bacterium]|nr:PAS domain-containing protein [Myxococcales bacterium]
LAADRARIVGEIEGHLAAGRDRFSQEYRLVADDGRVRWVEERTWVRREADGTPGWLEGIIVDQTARKRDEEALRRAKDAADAANAAKTRFLRVMSHELRTPLNAIMGMNDLLGDAPSPELRRDYLDTQLRACNGLMAMINDVLTLSEEEILGAEARPCAAPFELEELLGSVVDSFEFAARDKGLGLQVTRGDGLP